MSARALSLFSGIGGLDCGLARAGWRHVGFCEQEPYRRAVLAERFPGVPIAEDVRGLYAVPHAGEGRDGVGGFRGAPGDRRAAWADGEQGAAGGVDLLCGGFPCQDLSVAGRRAGLAGDRSGLFFEFARIASVLMPKWILLENVPGLLTSNDGLDFHVVLDTLQDLGYVPEVNILDSQHFGVPQRRKRVFLICVHVEHGRRTRTPISLPMLAQALTEISALILVAENARSITAPTSWGSGYANCVDGLRLRMKLFGATSRSGWMRLLDDFLGSLRRSAQELPAWAAHSDSARFGAGEKTATSWSAITTKDIEGAASSTESSLRRCWDDLWKTASAFTTSTSTSPTTTRATSTCAEIVASISECITPLIDSFPLCWNEDSSGSTARQVLTNFARSSSSSLFGDMDGVREWEHHALRAERVQEQLGGRAGAERAGQILAIGEGCRRHPPAGREAGAGATGGIADGAGVARPLTTGTSQRLDYETDDMIVGAVSTLQAPKGRGWRLDAEAAAGGHLIPNSASVRRLTPRECERLQGLPDDWTLIQWKGKPAADSLRYAALGDAVTANVGEWLGARLLASA